MINLLIKLKDNNKKINDLKSIIYDIQKYLAYEKVFNSEKEFFTKLKSYMTILQSQIKELNKKNKNLEKELSQKCPHEYLEESFHKGYYCSICGRYFDEEELNFSHTQLKGENLYFITQDLRKHIIEGNDINRILEDRISKSNNSTLRLIRREYEKK